MIKVYLAQPMSGKTMREIEISRAVSKSYALSILGRDNVEFINRYNQDWEHIDPMRAIAKSLDILADADLALFTPDWSESKGCIVEAKCCDLYDIPYSVIPQGYFDKRMGLYNEKL